MRLFSLAVGLLTLLGQDQVETTTPDMPEVVHVLAIHATQVDAAAAGLDPSVEPMREYLEALPYNSFREIGFHEIEAHYGSDAPAKLSEQYKILFRPNELTEDGDILFDCRIELADGDTILEALRVTGRATRGQGVVFRGLVMPEGEMIVLMSIAKAEQDPGGAGASGPVDDGGTGEGAPGEAAQGGQGEGVGEGEQVASPDTPSFEPPAPGEEPETTLLKPAQNAEDGEIPLPPDLAAMEGILRSLEEQDMQEQKNARNRRYEVVIQGDWW